MVNPVFFLKLRQILVLSGFVSQGKRMKKNQLGLESVSKKGWNWRMAAPWDPTSVFEFCYLEEEMKRSLPIVLEAEFRERLQRYFAHLIHLVDFCGLQNTWARLAHEWNQEGIPINRAWMGAALGGELAMAGIHEVAVELFSMKAGETLRLTPLHLWVIAESCRWMRLDLIPQCEASGGLSFSTPQELEKDLQIIAERFSEIDQVLEGEFDPYARIRLVKNN